MKPKRIIYLCLIVSASLIAFINFFCNKASTATNTSPYLNHQDSVKYVGIETCRSCHGDIYDTYILREDALYDQDLGDWIYQDPDLNNEIQINQQKKDREGKKPWDNFYFSLENDLQNLAIPPLGEPSDVEVTPF